MNSPSSETEAKARRSDVLDAIFDAVEETPESRTGPSQHLFRAKALKQVDIPQQIDNLLPLTSRRLWIAIIGVALTLLAGGLYAANTPQISSLTTQGRVVAAPGLASASSASDLAIERLLVEEEATVAEGDPIAVGSDPIGQEVVLLAPREGSVWQVLTSPGQVLAAGTPAITLLPSGSSDSVLVPIAEVSAGGVQPGQSASITSSRTVAQGTVTDVFSTPVPGSRAQSLTGLALDPTRTYVLVVLTPDESLRAGTEVTVEIVQSESTLLSELVSLD